MEEPDQVLRPELEAWLALARQPGNRDRAAAQLRQAAAELAAAGKVTEPSATPVAAASTPTGQPPAALVPEAAALLDAAPVPEPASPHRPVQRTPGEAAAAAAAPAAMMPPATPTASQPAASQPASGPRGSSTPAVRVALLGAGLFARSAYLPFLKQHPQEAQLVAVWSRSQASAAQLLDQAQGFKLAPAAAAYHGQEGMEQLLSRADVDAVLLVVPPQGMLPVVKQALAAGKHVLSEKPAGPTLAAAQELLGWLRAQPSAPLWAVEENYRAEPAFVRAAELVASGALGPILKLELVADLPLAPGAKYYASDWRRDTQGLPGSFMTEGAVHFLAALRMLAGAAGWGEAAAASAATNSTRPDLPPPDTLAGLVRFQLQEGGGQQDPLFQERGQEAAGQWQEGIGSDQGPAGQGRHLQQGGGAGERQPAATVSICFGGTLPRRSLTATGTQGTVEVVLGGWHATAAGSSSSSSYSILISQRAGEAAATTSQSLPISGVEEEVLSFLRCVARRSAHSGAHSSMHSREGQAPPAQPAQPEPAKSGGGGSSASMPAGASAGVALKGEEEEGREGEDAYRVSCLEAARDLALIEALLRSSQQGGQLVEVEQVA